MTDAILALTLSMARPVARGLMPLNRAYASIAAAVARADQDGTLEGTDDIAGHIAGWTFHLAQFVEREERKRAAARGAIVSSLRPLIATRQKSNQLLAEAHNANADHGYALTESDVADIVVSEVSWALQKERRHVR